MWSSISKLILYINPVYMILENFRFQATFMIKVYHSSSQFLSLARIDVTIQDLQFDYFYWKLVECTLLTQTAPIVETTSRSPLLSLNSCQRMCHDCFILSLQLGKKNCILCLYMKKKCVHYLKFCVYTWIHIVIFFFLWEYCCDVFIHAIGRSDIWLFLVLHVSK